jgi:hypothetical protein
MGAIYRNKYTILRNWLFRQYQIERFHITARSIKRSESDAISMGKYKAQRDRQDQNSYQYVSEEMVPHRNIASLELVQEV